MTGKSVRAVSAILALTITCLAVEKKPPDFSGNWKLNLERSSGPSVAQAATALEITQRGDEIKFRYIFRGASRGIEAFLADDKERERYITRIERAHARAEWRKDELLITTRHFMDAQGTQQYSDTELWRISEDKNTLTQRASDGTLLVYQKVDPDDDPVIPPDPLDDVGSFRAVGLITGRGPCRGTSFDGTMRGEKIGSGTFSFCGPLPKNWGQVGSCSPTSGTLTFGIENGASSFKLDVMGEYCVSQGGSTFRGTFVVEKDSATGSFAGRIAGGSGEIVYSNVSNTISLSGALLRPAADRK